LGVELEGRPLLRSTKPEEELAVQCIHQVSMLLAEEGKRRMQPPPRHARICVDRQTGHL
jgi:hypothetical protein